MRYRTTVESPVGRLVLVSDGLALTGLLFADQREEAPQAGASGEERRVPPLLQAERELAEYFAGRRATFTVPLAPGGTLFQRRVWEALGRIPFAATATYGGVARAVGSPQAVRAVGGACARNPLAIVVPCHRVVGAGGALGGYAGGLARKRALLELEALHATGRRRPRAGPAGGAIGRGEKKAPGSPRVP